MSHVVGYSGHVLGDVANSSNPQHHQRHQRRRDFSRLPLLPLSLSSLSLSLLPSQFLSLLPFFHPSLFATVFEGGREVIYIVILCLCSIHEYAGLCGVCRAMQGHVGPCRAMQGNAAVRGYILASDWSYACSET